jgi:predicted metalloprotease
MKWENERRSENVEDRRGMSPGVRAGGIGGIGLVVVLLISFFTGINPQQLLGMLEGAPNEASAPANVPQGGRAAGGSTRDPQADFVSVILGSTEDTWGEIFAESGRRYEPPRLVLFDGVTQTACGMGQAAMGPFYCPPDRQLYIDLSFFRELAQRFGAPGDFAQAYVVAHEVGHHVQNLLGIANEVQGLRQRAAPREANALSVLMELQADCLAGVWAYRAQQRTKWLDTGDAEEGMRAAAAVGDDMIQKSTQGRVVPERWTHGSSAQRVQWFRQGMTTGRVDQCDTFRSARR